MPETTPVQLMTLLADTLRAEQWRLALLLLTATTRPLTVTEIAEEVHLLSRTLADAEITWKE